VLGFLAVFVLALATWLLLRNMTGHLRRLNYREEQRRAAEAQEAQRPVDGRPAAGSPGSPGSPESP